MKLSPLIITALLATPCAALDLATDLLVSRTNYDLEPLEKATHQESLVFRVYVRPAMSLSGYALEGRVTVPQTGEASGTVILFEQLAHETKSRTFRLTHLQTRRVYNWFSDARFLDPKIKETVAASVLDGVELVIEGFIDGRYFRLRRNAGDSESSGAFFKQLEAFRVWKEEEPNQTSEPTAPSGRGSP